MRILVASDGAEKWPAAMCEIRKCGYFMGGDAIFAFSIAYKIRNCSYSSKNCTISAIQKGGRAPGRSWAEFVPNYPPLYNLTRALQAAALRCRTQEQQEEQQQQEQRQAVGCKQ